MTHLGLMTSSNPHAPSPLLIVNGHPDGESYCHALAEAYADGANSVGASATVLHLHALQFDPVLHRGYQEAQALEPDLERAKALIEAARHVVVVSPLWWGSIPALLKGFFDRLFLPGWAFRMKPNGLPEGLLAGRSARLILTMDSPGYWYRFAYGRAAHKAVVNATLRFCGFSPVRATAVYKVGQLSDAERARWLHKIARLGAADAPRALPLRIETSAGSTHRH